MFFVLSLPRCGSNMLATALDTHPELHNFGELLHHRRYRRQIMRYGTREWLIRNDLQENDFFVAHFTSPDHPKVKVQHVDFWNWMSRTHGRVILLQRENILRRAVSLAMLHKTGAWQRRDGDPPNSEKVHISTAFLRRVYTETTHAYSCIKRLFPNGLRVTYEQLCRSQDTTLRRVQEYLGVATMQLSVRTLQQELRPLSDVVSNYSQLRNALMSNRKFSRFF